MYKDLFKANETDFELIDTLSDLLIANNIPHDVHKGPADGWQITFDWCDGDVVCSWGTFHILESYRFPWDKDDVTRTNPETMARMIFNYYHDIVFKE